MRATPGSNPGALKEMKGISIGRAFPWHGRGNRFESGMVHKIILKQNYLDLLFSDVIFRLGQTAHKAVHTITEVCMTNEYFFELPDDAQIKSKLVEAIPADWQWVDGILRAPEELIERKEVALKTGYLLAQFHRIRPTIVGEYISLRQRQPADVFAIMGERKLPAFVEFREAGREEPPEDMTFEVAKRVASIFISKDYKGKLYFGRDYPHEKHYNSARCAFALESWKGAPCLDDEEGFQPARIKIEWDEPRGINGAVEDTPSIVELCRILHLTEYSPRGNSVPV